MLDVLITQEIAGALGILSGLEILEHKTLSTPKDKGLRAQYQELYQELSGTETIYVYFLPSVL